MRAMTVRRLSRAEALAAQRDAARVAAWGLAIYVVARVVAALLASMSMAALVAQALLVEWQLAKRGVTWSDPLAPLPSGLQLARRASKGALVGGGIALALVVVLAVTKGASFTRGPAPASLILLGLATAGLTAWRDELLLHGVVFRALSSVQRAAPVALACGLTSIGAALAEPHPTPWTVATRGLFGVVLGVLWVMDRGAWQPWAANTAFTFVVSTVLGGGLVETTVARSVWGGADAGVLGGAAATCVLAASAIAGLVRSGHGPTKPT